MKKVPAKYSEEELLKVLTEASKEQLEAKESPDDVLAFVSAFNIKPGQQKVLKRVLYRLYASWTKNKVPVQTFNTSMNEMFSRSRFSRPYVSINLDVITVKEQIAEYKAHRVNKLTNPKYIRHFNRFIKENNIAPGTEPVEGYLIYFLYDKWWYNKDKRKTPIGQITFYKFLQQHFAMQYQKRSLVKMFKLDKSFYDNFTEESLSRIRNGYNEKKKRIRPNKEKRKKEASSQKEPS